MSRFSICTTAALVVWQQTNAQQSPPAWITEGPYVETPEFSIELPLDVLASKLYVDVEIGGEPRRFVFDTGSPSMMSKALADELGLKPVDSREGRDSHGAVVRSDIVQADMTLGGTTFHKVPVFAADFSSSTVVQCLIGDGVLGSEVLPLCAWQIDLPDSTLRCSTETGALDHVDGAKRQRLYDFGYPHAPILDVRFADEATSKAMFDTGSPGYFTISPPDFDGAEHAGGVKNTTSGYGSLGGSLGGQAPNAAQRRGELSSLAIGNVDLGSVQAHVREFPPSLIGASILEHYVVSLDARSQSAYFDRYRDASFVRPSFGFSLGFENEVSIALVWEGSPAAEAGLQAGQRVTAINGRKTDNSCEGIRYALRAMEGSSIEVEWEAGVAELARE